MNRRRLVRVPATTANLGPGFDVLAAALSMHVEVEVVETGRFAIQTDLRIARDRRNLCARGFAALADPSHFAFRIKSDVPLSGGLGTSAAAYLAGLLAADSMFELDADVLAEATRLEGHPDNVAAALHGGFVACVDGEVSRLGVPTGLEAVLVVPDEQVRTKQARAALPSEVPFADAIANVGAVSLLMLGLAREDMSLISRGLADKLHQPYRAHLYPRSADLVNEATSLGALGATISGAGPTVLVWSAYEATGGVVAALRERCEGWATVARVPFEENGAQVREI